MPTHEVRDRRGRAARGDEGLLDRGATLTAIDELLESASAGAENALLIIGHPGMGKTRLHEAALDRARARDLMVVRAAGSQLEQNAAFGVAAELLRSLLGAIPARSRDALLAEAPEHIRSLHGTDPDLDRPGPEPELAVSHGLFSLLAAAVERRPALVAIDDIHWADAASLEFVMYLLHRLGELPVGLLLTTRPGEDEDGLSALDAIAAHPRVMLQTLMPLSREAVRELVAGALGSESAESLTDVSFATTSGNPFYLHELLLALSEERGSRPDQLAARARALAPDAVTRAVRVRVARLGADAVALARAVAVLGDDAPVRQAAALSGLNIASASVAADALASVEVLLAREPLRFVHPLVRNAIELDIPASQRSSRHLEAARLLYADGEGPERVAAHLLLGRAEGDEWVVQQLRAAAREARSRAAAQSVLRYLERALAEPPPDEVRGDVLAELGGAEAALGLKAAERHFELAARVASGPERRAELSLARGRAVYAQGLHEQAARAFQEGLDELADMPEDPAVRELHDRLQTGFVASAAIVPSLQARILDLAREVIERPPSGPLRHGHRLALAQAAVSAALTGESAATVIELALRAWDSGQLLESETSSGVSWILVTAALSLAGDLERSLDTAEAAVADARRRGAPLAFATASYMRGLPQLWQGNVDGALADLELARDARRYGWRQYVRTAAAHYCLCLIETGELDRAEAALTENEPLEAPYDAEDAIRLYALAELRRTEGRFDQALETALTAGRIGEATLPFLGNCPWRTSAAESALALGDRDQALKLSREAFERAERTGALHDRIRALRILAQCEGGESGLARLREAVELGRSSPPRLETIYSMIELGSTLRRGNERSAAREPLQIASDLAKQGGATALAQRAKTELAATGARPRRETFLSGTGSLTPSERRIAALAALGRSNRDIAGALFVTPKTVEYHLRNVYRKLGIQSRRELAGALE